MVNSSDSAFSSQLATQKLPQALHTKKGKRGNKELHEGSLAALLPDTPLEGQTADEHESVAEEDEQDDDDDLAQHEHSKPAAASAGGKQLRVQWKAEMEEQLQQAILAYVVESGRLPPQLKTGKHAIVSADWKNIGRMVKALDGKDAAAVGKACSTKWAKMKKELKVCSSFGLLA
jgi:hypothetical protein